MMWYVGVVNDENTSMKGGKMSIRLEVYEVRVNREAIPESVSLTEMVDHAL